MVHYFSAGLKRIITMAHIILLKVIYGKNLSYKGRGVVDISSHFVVNDEGK